MLMVTMSFWWTSSSLGFMVSPWVTVTSNLTGLPPPPWFV